MFKEIKKLWNSGKYNSTRELVEAYCEQKHIDLYSKDKYVKQDLFVIKHIANNIIQGGDGRWWK